VRFRPHSSFDEQWRFAPVWANRHRAVVPEGLKMCVRPDFEEMEAEHDAHLMALFRAWKAHGNLFLDDEELETMSLVEDLCNDIRRRLPDLIGKSQSCG